MNFLRGRGGGETDHATRRLREPRRGYWTHGVHQLSDLRQQVEAGIFSSGIPRICLTECKLLDCAALTRIKLNIVNGLKAINNFIEQDAGSRRSGIHSLRRLFASCVRDAACGTGRGAKGTGGIAARRCLIVGIFHTSGATP